MEHPFFPAPRKNGNMVITIFLSPVTRRCSSSQRVSDPKKEMGFRAGWADHGAEEAHVRVWGGLPERNPVCAREGQCKQAGISETFWSRRQSFFPEFGSYGSKNGFSCDCGQNSDPLWRSISCPPPPLFLSHLCRYCVCMKPSQGQQKLHCLLTSTFGNDGSHWCEFQSLFSKAF